MNATTAPTIDPVLDPGQDPTELLTIAELDMIGRRIGGDPVAAVQEATAGRWKALALMGWCLDKRRNAQAAEAVWMALTVPQLMDALAIDTDEDPATAETRQAAADEADRANPSAPTPAPE